MELCDYIECLETINFGKIVTYLQLKKSPVLV